MGLKKDGQPKYKKKNFVKLITVIILVFVVYASIEAFQFFRNYNFSSCTSPDTLSYSLPINFDIDSDIDVRDKFLVNGRFFQEVPSKELSLSRVNLIGHDILIFIDNGDEIRKLLSDFNPKLVVPESYSIFVREGIDSLRFNTKVFGGCYSDTPVDIDLVDVDMMVNNEKHSSLEDVEIYLNNDEDVYNIDLSWKGKFLHNLTLNVFVLSDEEFKIKKYEAIRNSVDASEQDIVELIDSIDQLAP